MEGTFWFGVFLGTMLAAVGNYFATRAISKNNTYALISSGSLIILNYWVGWLFLFPIFCLLALAFKVKEDKEDKEKEVVGESKVKEIHHYYHKEDKKEDSNE